MLESPDTSVEDPNLNSGQGSKALPLNVFPTRSMNAEVILTLNTYIDRVSVGLRDSAYMIHRLC